VWRYCGEYWDVETETIYLRARYYNPRIGRFTQSDPAQDGLNWYTYCVNNPIRYWDPSGYAVTEWDQKYVTNKNDLAQLYKLTDMWVAAEANGNKLGMAEAHRLAAAIRDKYITPNSGTFVRSDGQIGVDEDIISGQVNYGIAQSTQYLQTTGNPSYEEVYNIAMLQMQAPTTNQSPEEVKTEVVQIDIK